MSLLIRYGFLSLFLLPNFVYAAPISFIAYLKGANEVDASGNPVASDPIATGVAKVQVDGDLVTWKITVNGLQPVVAAHIHKQNPSQFTGPVVVDFNAMLDGVLNDIDALGITPTSFADYYVNLHTAAYPAGAIRGQLMLVPEPVTFGLLLIGVAFAGRRFLGAPPKSTLPKWLA